MSVRALIRKLGVQTLATGMLLAALGVCALPERAHADDCTDPVYLSGNLSGPYSYSGKHVYVSGRLTGNVSIEVEDGRITVGNIDCFDSMYADNGVNAYVDCSGDSDATAGDPGAAGFSLELIVTDTDTIECDSGIEVTGYVNLSGQYGGNGGSGSASLVCYYGTPECFFKYPQPGQQGGPGGSGGNFTATSDGYVLVSGTVVSTGGNGGNGGDGGSVNNGWVSTYTPGIAAEQGGEGREGGTGGAVSITAGTFAQFTWYSSITSMGGSGGSGGAGGSSGTANRPGRDGGDGGEGGAVTVQAPDVIMDYASLYSVGGAGGSGNWGGSGAGVSCYNDCGCSMDQNCDTTGPGEEGGGAGVGGAGGDISVLATNTIDIYGCSFSVAGGYGGNGGTISIVIAPGNSGAMYTIYSTTFYTWGGYGGVGGNAGSSGGSYCASVVPPIYGGLGGGGGDSGTVIMNAGDGGGDVDTSFIYNCGGAGGLGGWNADGMARNSTGSTGTDGVFDPTDLNNAGVSNNVGLECN